MKIGNKKNKFFFGAVTIWKVFLCIYERRDIHVSFLTSGSCIVGSVLCVGSEWHRFPSSFFVPDFVGEVRWIDDGFRGLLPLPFNSTLGGTAAAPPYFNNENKASNEQYVIIPVLEIG